VETEGLGINLELHVHVVGGEAPVEVGFPVAVAAGKGGAEIVESQLVLGRRLAAPDVAGRTGW